MLLLGWFTTQLDRGYDPMYSSFVILPFTMGILLSTMGFTIFKSLQNKQQAMKPSLSFKIIYTSLIYDNQIPTKEKTKPK